MAMTEERLARLACCPACGGTGIVYWGSDASTTPFRDRAVRCTACGGTGQIVSLRPIEKSLKDLRCATNQALARAEGQVDGAINWAVTNDALDAEQDWAVEIRFGGEEDADFDAEIYNALPEALAEVRRLREAVAEAHDDIVDGCGFHEDGHINDVRDYDNLTVALHKMDAALTEEVPRG